MALTSVPKNQIGSPKNDIRETVTVESGATSDWYTFGSGVNQVNVDFIPVSGSGRVETTNNIEGAKAGTAEGIPWEDGDVSGTTAAVSTGCAAFRIVSVSGVCIAHFNAVRA